MDQTKKISDKILYKDMGDGHLIKMKGYNEGETCMHDNSWHSECMLCSSESLIDDLLRRA